MATTYDYAPQYRPPDFTTVPDGWEFVARGEHCNYPGLAHLPFDSAHAFGVIRYQRRLTDEEVREYQLKRV